MVKSGVFRTITLVLIALLCVAALHRNSQIVECVRYGYNFKKRINVTDTMSYLIEEKADKERRRKDDDEAHRRYRIFQTYLANEGVLERTSVLRDFYSGRFK
jgi:hypothetical protein